MRDRGLAAVGQVRFHGRALGGQIGRREEQGQPSSPASWRRDRISCSAVRHRCNSPIPRMAGHSAVDTCRPRRLWHRVTTCRSGLRQSIVFWVRCASPAAASRGGVIGRASPHRFDIMPRPQRTASATRRTRRTASRRRRLLETKLPDRIGSDVEGQRDYRHETTGSGSRALLPLHLSRRRRALSPLYALCTVRSKSFVDRRWYQDCTMFTRPYTVHDRALV